MRRPAFHLILLFFPSFFLCFVVSVFHRRLNFNISRTCVCRFLSCFCSFSGLLLDDTLFLSIFDSFPCSFFVHFYGCVFRFALSLYMHMWISSNCGLNAGFENKKIHSEICALTDFISMSLHFCEYMWVVRVWWSNLQRKKTNEMFLLQLKIWCKTKEEMWKKVFGEFVWVKHSSDWSSS